MPPYEDIAKTGPQNWRTLQEQNNPYAPENYLKLSRAERKALRDATRYYAPAKETLTENQLPQGFGESRFDKDVPDYALDNLGDFRAENQSGLEQIFNGVLKGATIAGTTFANTFVGIPVGTITAIAEGRFSGLWDNAITNTMNNIEEWAEKELPNYYTQEELENPWYTNIFSANFLGDTLIKNFGFTFGAGAAGKIIGRLPKFLPKIAGKIATTAGKNAQDINAIARATNTFETGLISAIGEGSIEALNGTKEWSAERTNQVMAEQASRLQGLQQEYENEYTAIQQQYGNTEIGQQLIASLQLEMQNRAKELDNETNQKLAQIASQRAQLGNAILGFNLPILTLSNMALLGRVYSGGWKAEQQALGNKFISSNLDELSMAGKTTTETTRNWLGKEVTKDIAHNVYKNELTLARNVLRGAKQPTLEGIEELTQAVASNTVKDYNNDFYANATDPDATEQTANMWRSLNKQFGETLSDINAWEEFFVGMISGGISNIVLGANKGLTQERQQTQELVDMLNDRVNNFNNRNMIQGLNRHGRYGDQMVEAAIRGDKKDFKDAEFAQTVSDVIMWAEAGKLDDLKQIIDYNLDNNLTDEELENIAESLSQKDSEGGEHNSFAAGSNEYRRQYIQNQKDKYHKVIDMYANERDNIVGLVGNAFNKEELSELTYLRLRAQDSATRSEELKDSLLKKIDALNQRNLGEQYKAKTEGIEAIKIKKILEKNIKDDSELIEKIKQDKTLVEGLYNRDHQGEIYYEKLRTDVINKAEKRIKKHTELLEKHTGKLLTNEAKMSMLNKIFALSSNNKTTYDSALSFIRDNFNQIIDLNANKLSAGNVFEVAQNIDNLISIINSIQSNETTVKELQTTIEDAIRLVEDANNYNQKLNDFINNPEKLKTKNEGLIERARNRKIEKEADKVEDDIANTESFDEFNKKLNNLDPRVKNKVLQRLKNKQNQNALNYDEKIQQINIVLRYINESDESPIIKRLAINLFTNAADSLSSEDMLNIDSPIYSRESNQNLDDETYIKVKTLLAQAFNYQSNETSEPKQTDTLNVEEKPIAKEKKKQTLQETIEEMNAELDEEEGADLDDDTQTVTKDSVTEESIPTPVLMATPETHQFNEGPKTPVVPINIQNNNLTNTEIELNEQESVTLPSNQEPSTKGSMAMGMQEIDTKANSINRGKPVIEEVDNEGKPTEVATNSRPLYEYLKSQGVFDAVDNGVVKKDSKVYFGVVPGLDRDIATATGYNGITILLYIDGRCVGHLPINIATKLGLQKLLFEEFNDKVNNDSEQYEPLISKYYTTVDDLWSGIILYNSEYRTLTDDDLTWIRNRINSSTTSEEDRTPLITIFNGTTDFTAGSKKFTYGVHIAPVYMNNPLYKGAPVLLVPTGAYDRNKPNTNQDKKAFIPVALRRVKLSNIENTTTYNQVLNTINNLFSSTPTIKQLNEIIGELKKKITYEFGTPQGNQQVFIVPARQLNREGNPIVEMTPQMFSSAATKFEDAKVTHLIIQRKINGKVVNSYTVGIAQGNFQNTQILPQDLLDANKEAFLNFLREGADAYVNIEQSRLDDPTYVQQIIDDGLLQTNAKELRVRGNSFHMKEEISKDDESNSSQPEQPEQPVPQEPVTNNNGFVFDPSDPFANVITEGLTSNPLLDLLGNNNPLAQAPTEGEDDIRTSIVTETTPLGTIDIDKEINNILKVLPQLNREEAFKIVDNLIKVNDEGAEAQGIFNKGLITLSKLAQAGTGYHEAYHLVFNMLLTNTERNDLFKEYNSKYPNLTLIELEERMADDFREYALLNENRINTSSWISRVSNKVLNWFKDLLNILHLYRNEPLTFNTVCSNIWQGKYAYRKLQNSSNTGEFSKENDAVRYSLVPQIRFDYNGPVVENNGNTFSIADLSIERFQRLVDSQVNNITYNTKTKSVDMNNRWGQLIDRWKSIGINIKGIKNKNKYVVDLVTVDNPNITYYNQKWQQYLQQRITQKPEDLFNIKDKCY